MDDESDSLGDIEDEEEQELVGVPAGDEDDLLEDELAAGGGEKNSHRAIPAWEEAIGYIISVNMDARAKNPKSGPPRGGRSRGRGGRGGSGGSRGNGPRRT